MRDLFGFLLYTPVRKGLGVVYHYFTATAIFAPVARAFSEEAPK